MIKLLDEETSSEETEDGRSRWREKGTKCHPIVMIRAWWRLALVRPAAPPPPPQRRQAVEFVAERIELA